MEYKYQQDNLIVFPFWLKEREGAKKKKIEMNLMTVVGLKYVVGYLYFVDVEEEEEEEEGNTEWTKDKI